MKLLAVALYPLLLVARLLNLVMGRDPLRLRRPKSDSYWITRDHGPDLSSYFLETSVAEGREHGGFGRLATTTLQAVAARFASTKGAGGGARALPDRDKDIPDEIYPLW